MKQTDLYYMLYNIANAGALKAAAAISGLPNQENTFSFPDRSKNNIWVTEKLLTLAINHGNASKNINNKIKPVWVAPSGNSITYPPVADRSR
jgi:hypothetical protein